MIPVHRRFAILLVLVAKILIFVYHEEVLQVESFSEFKLLVVLHHLVKLRVVLKPVQRNLQHRRQLHKPHELLSVLLSVIGSFILVFSFQLFSSNVLADAVLNGVRSFDHTQLEGVEDLGVARLVVNVDALDHAFQSAFKQVLVCPFDRCLLHLAFQQVAQQAVEFVHILLLVEFVVRPAKCLQQFKCADIVPAHLKIVENSLQAKWNRLGRVAL